MRDVAINLTFKQPAQALRSYEGRIDSERYFMDRIAFLEHTRPRPALQPFFRNWLFQLRRRCVGLQPAKQLPTYIVSIPIQLPHTAQHPACVAPV